MGNWVFAAAESLNAMAAKLAPPKEDPAANRGRKAGPSGGNNAKPSANLPMFTDCTPSPATVRAGFGERRPGAL